MESNVIIIIIIIIVSYLIKVIISGLDFMYVFCST